MAAVARRVAVVARNRRPCKRHSFALTAANPGIIGDARGAADNAVNKSSSFGGGEVIAVVMRFYAHEKLSDSDATATKPSQTLSRRLRRKKFEQQP